MWAGLLQRCIDEFFRVVGGEAEPLNTVESCERRSASNN
jgi:hypothetical protein